MLAATTVVVRDGRIEALARGGRDLGRQRGWRRPAPGRAPRGPFLNPAWQAYPLSSLAVTHAAAARPLCRIVSAFNPITVSRFGEEPTERWCRQSRSYSGGRLA